MFDDLHGDREDLYRPEFVRRLFDEMSQTYGVVNLIASFGFCVLWRRQCTRQVDIRAGETVFDLMSGMGELWPAVAAMVGPVGRLCGVDFSPAMCARSRRTAERIQGPNVEMREEDILDNSIPRGAADVVVSSFGLKTFTREQRARLAGEIARVLRPGGRLSLLEISVPTALVLRWPYMAYLDYVVPLIGRLLLGNPDNYRLLGVYTSRFRDCSDFVVQCADAGLRVRLRRFFFGCATAVVGEKPLETDDASGCR
jgi:demethylmenaquinone methyltransferase/2-methoxy-6-polyprenyl-1,4-benzoquinol methylase